MSKVDDPPWFRTQHTIRKLLPTLGKDSLVYAPSDRRPILQTHGIQDIPEFIHTSSSARSVAST
jgi:hypothetical protein